MGRTLWHRKLKESAGAMADERLPWQTQLLGLEPRGKKPVWPKREERNRAKEREKIVASSRQ